jgi:hypothetical protein
VKTYEDKLLENERATTRWLVRLKRASNKIEKLRAQRIRMLRGQAKALTKEADATEKAAPEPGKIPGVPGTVRPAKAKRSKPERRINL